MFLNHRFLFLKRCSFYFFILLCCSCNTKRGERNVQRSFYYWKTVFDLKPTELATLNNLQVQNLYVKFFDVDWDANNRTAVPVAKSIFNQVSANFKITPVIFITQKPLQQLNKQGLDSLAVNIDHLLTSITLNNQLPVSSEVQLDCDWTSTTRKNYFYLIDQLKTKSFFKQKIISATIRLHQLKFLSQNGVPPVAKGLLMCYNMGNLRYPQSKNSIIDENELVKYINHLETYPLPVDVALPIFDWWILFEGQQYKGLIRDFQPGGEWQHKARIQFSSDTSVNGHSFKKGQWLRHETSQADVIKNCAEAVSKKIKASKLTVILYHLDQNNLSKYSQNELESFFDSFR